MIVCSMRIILVFILLAFGFNKTTVNSQQTTDFVHKRATDNSQQTLCTSDACSRTVDRCPLSVDYYESQIRKADSLYKNYLPQYNFDEVKAAMEFFDSIRNEELAIRNYGGRKAIPNSTFLIPNYQCAKAHYYHAVGLTEKDDIVGACEHYLIALEIMEEDDLIKRHKDAKTQRRKVLKKQRNDEKTLCDSVTLRLCDSNKEDYEKIRFVALIYTRLGQLFLNENYYNLALIHYKSAYISFKFSNDSIFNANTLKHIGNVYHLLNNQDSALYYYNESLKTNADLTNKLDLEKNIAKILFQKGEKDSAYILIKDNIDKIENANVRYSYYNILGEMCIDDKEYDSAVYYLTKSVNSNIPSIKATSSIRLSAIYDSLGNYEKKVYYNDIVSEILLNDINKNIETNKLQYLYDRYKKRNAEKEESISIARTKVFAISLSALVFIAFAVIFLIWHRSNRKDKYIASKNEIINKIKEEIKQNESEIKKLVGIIGILKSNIISLKEELEMKELEISGKETDIKKMENDLSAKESDLKKLQKNVFENSVLIDRLNEDHKSKEERITAHLEEIEKLKTEINETRNNLNDLKFRSSFTEGRIKSQNSELKKKEELIKKYTTEISNLKYRLDRKHVDISNLNNYLKSDVCSKVLKEVNKLSEKKLKSNMLTPLSKEEFVVLLNSANHHLNYFINDMANKYPKLKKDDLYYLCLVVIGLDNYQISSLFGVTHDAINKRKNKICTILGIDTKNSLNNYLLDLIKSY